MSLWLPDGRGLDPETLAAVADLDLRVHLRLTNGEGYPRVACGRGLGELWTGIGSEVTCPACLEVVHA